MEPASWIRYKSVLRRITRPVWQAENMEERPPYGMTKRQEDQFDE
jgi:hypothetical protein